MRCLFDGDGNRMTPSHAGKKGTRYRYYISGSLITKDGTENSAGLRVPAAEIEQLVSDRVHRWLLDPGSIYKSTLTRLGDASTLQRLVARAADIGKHWPELPVARKRALSGKRPAGYGGVRGRLLVWVRSPIAGIVFRRSSSNTPYGCTFASLYAIVMSKSCCRTRARHLL
jgi:hypothetical protein